MMLDHDTKRRIDSARDILVGKVPDPKSQVEQITIALIYKFMDDMDGISESLGGKRGFFTGAFEKYGWNRLVRSGLGGHETLNLYADAVSQMPEHPNIPRLFTEIFKDAYLPYRDPETLRQFLRVIDWFDYGRDYERLGDAFEHLLSIMGSQGDAGQFRTPRHIIDFIVGIVDPRKDETVLDPACGTAGFLISAYKHILDASRNEHGHPDLSPYELEALARNIRGYDISPGMVRLSLVNLYLHKFQVPRIAEYDTLTSDDRWDERANVILANPPFFSPKGGGVIQPHSRFQIRSRRTEVLFVDYIMQHLTSSGRAGVIVPEGIIFQSQNAHRSLRENLVKDYLAAVVSLPAGVFNPYSGVKTSILILDRAVARSSDTVGFFRVDSDGFDLGAQRRPVDSDDLPEVQSQVCEYLDRLRSGRSLDGFEPSLGLVVAKDKIRQDPDFNLSMERYRENTKSNNKYPDVELGEITIGKPQYGSGARKVDYDGNVRYVRITDLTDDGELKPDAPVSPSTIEPELFLEPGDLLIARSGSVGRTYLHKDIPGTYQYAGYLIRFRIDPDRAMPEYVYRTTKSQSWKEWISSNSKTGTLTNINAKQYSSFKLPLPPLSVQREIVAEISGYQSVIDGAMQVVRSYKPHIHVDPEWPTTPLGDVCEVINGSTPSRQQTRYWDERHVPWFTVNDIRKWGRTVRETQQYVTHSAIEETSLRILPPKAVLICCTASVGEYAITEIPVTTNQQFNGLVIKDEFKSKLTPEFLFMLSSKFKDELIRLSGKTSFNFVSGKSLKTIPIAIPSIETQRALVTEVFEEENLIESNKELISRFERKIEAAVNRVWEE